MIATWAIRNNSSVVLRRSVSAQRSTEKLRLWLVRELTAPPTRIVVPHVARRQGGGRAQSSLGTHHLCFFSVGFGVCSALLNLCRN